MHLNHYIETKRNSQTGRTVERGKWKEERGKWKVESRKWKVERKRFKGKRQVQMSDVRCQEKTRDKRGRTVCSCWKRLIASAKQEKHWNEFMFENVFGFKYFCIC